MPPTERRGRVHTSTVTVAVIEAVPEKEWSLPDGEIETRTTRGSGPGGQNRNKVESCVVLRHIPTNTVVRVDSRDQHRNRKAAREILESRVAGMYRKAREKEANERRKNLVGSGERGDKIRTYREMDNVVSDHRTGKKASLAKIRLGHLGPLS